MYLFGDGVSQDCSAAEFWFRQAANRGNVRAQHSLGMMYFMGDGMPQDYIQACRWLDIAMAGIERTEDKEMRDATIAARSTVAKKMTPAQIAEAQRLAREWKPGSDI
jgi:TPR repeat protein